MEFETLYLKFFIPHYTEELIHPEKRDKGHETCIDIVEKTKNKYSKCICFRTELN
jgi:hypothetical protein